MNPSTETIHNVIHPTAIFCHQGGIDNHASQDSAKDHAPSWEASQLNPKNRIDSLAPLRSPLWKIDGCAGLGTQFYAVPLFLGDIPPMRCDVLLSEDATESPLIRDLLDLDTVFHARDRARVQRQGVCHYILRALQVWTVKHGFDKTRDIYYDLPFGTRIIFQNLPLNIRDIEIHVVPGYNLETHHCSARELAEMWQMNADDRMPPTLDIFDLVFVEQLQDSVCTVRFRHDAAPDRHENGPQDTLWVLKALTSSSKFMYHELRVLLSMTPHENIVARPTRLVTKKCKMNNVREVVVGFLLPFYSGGGMRDQLPLLRIQGTLELRDQIRWAKDICSGMLHIRTTANTYYPDLRLDQIVFSHDRQRPIILDFEQRGVWVEFGSPEVNALEYIRLLALEEEDESNLVGSPVAAGLNGAGEPSPRPGPQHFSDMLTRLCPDWRGLCVHDAYYDNPRDGYNVPWICLTAREQEHAEVYMLGRLLWCILEGMAAPQRGAVWQSYHREPDFDFPEFRRTPPALRGLVARCTRGHRDQLSNYVVRKGSRIVLRDGDGGGAGAGGDGTPAEIMAVSRAFWTREVRWAEEFVLERARRLEDGSWDENYFGRGTLREVEAALSSFQSTIAEDVGGDLN